MKVLYSLKDERCELAISDDSDWMLFNGVADAILRRFRGKLVERLDGLDERYWDIEIRRRIVTLHGFAQKVVFTTIWFFSAISAYLCDLWVSVVARNIYAEITEVRRARR